MEIAHTWNVKKFVASPSLRSAKQAQLALLEKLDIFTRQHSYRVQQLVLKLGGLLNIQGDELRDLGHAGLFHDIGKIAVDKKILYKESRLSANETQVIRQHVEIGAKLWLQAGGYYRISEAILTHHENFDGSGYPFGLSGTEIPLWGRIIAVADALDAILSERPYKHGTSLKRAVERIRQARGKQFDPKIVDALNTSYSQNGFASLYETLWKNGESDMARLSPPRDT